MNAKLILKIQDIKIKCTKANTKVLKNQDSAENIELTPLVKSLTGTFHINQDFDYKKE